MKPTDTGKFIVAIDSATRAEIREARNHARSMANDYTTPMSKRPLWRDLMKLLNRELARYK